MPIRPRRDWSQLVWNSLESSRRGAFGERCWTAPIQLLPQRPESRTRSVGLQPTVTKNTDAPFGVDVVQVLSKTEELKLKHGRLHLWNLYSRLQVQQLKNKIFSNLSLSDPCTPTSVGVQFYSILFPRSYNVAEHVLLV